MSWLSSVTAIVQGMIGVQYLRATVQEGSSRVRESILVKPDSAGQQAILLPVLLLVLFGMMYVTWTNYQTSLGVLSGLLLHISTSQVMSAYSMCVPLVPPFMSRWAQF